MKVALAAIATLACTSSGSGPPMCGAPAFSFWSPCGFENVTTTCAGGPPDCFTQDTEGFCDLGTVMSNCTVSVVLGDGTSHDFSITVAQSSDPACNGQLVVTSLAPNFTSPTCMPPDAGPDTGSD
jgi:hypothetical protein